MAKKIKDKNGNVYVEAKPWYKKWWIWVIAVLALLFIIGAVGGNSGHKAGSGSATKVPSTITVDYDDYDVDDAKTYSVSYSNSDWPSANVNINKITVYKLSKPYKYDSANNGKFNINGFIKLHFKIKANSDISIYPEQGTANFGSEQQDSATETWDGNINKGATKSGNVYIPVKDLKSVSSIKNLRFKFSANGQNNFDDSHDYDITLNLKN